MCILAVSRSFDLYSCKTITLIQRSRIKIVSDPRCQQRLYQVHTKSVQPFGRDEVANMQTLSYFQICNLYIIDTNKITDIQIKLLGSFDHELLIKVTKFFL